MVEHIQKVVREPKFVDGPGEPVQGIGVEIERQCTTNVRRFVKGRLTRGQTKYVLAGGRPHQRLGSQRRESLHSATS